MTALFLCYSLSQGDRPELGDAGANSSVVLPGVHAAEWQTDTNVSDLTDAGVWPPDGH
jgi:hypothetical protein